MDSLFETLYRGNYAPAEAPLPPSYREKLRACHAYYDKVSEQFGIAFLNEMWSAQADAASEEVLAAYIAGVRFGGQFMLELLAKE